MSALLKLIIKLTKMYISGHVSNSNEYNQFKFTHTKGIGKRNKTQSINIKMKALN
jgi:hypothetical protein